MTAPQPITKKRKTNVNTTLLNPMSAPPIPLAHHKPKKLIIAMLVMLKERRRTYPSNRNVANALTGKPILDLPSSVYMRSVCAISQTALPIANANMTRINGDM